MNAVLDILGLQRRTSGDPAVDSVAATGKPATDTAPCPLTPSHLRPETMKFQYEPGSQPLPRYTIRRGLGVGGFGEVYFAISDAGKEVAIKRVQRNLEVELRGVSHCLNLKHPNLVSLYDICRDDADQAWVVMEYIAGPNLREVLDGAPQGLPLDEIRRWFTGIAAGVQHLHASGLVHRDLKPGNVFDDLGVVKVGDYGLSKFISASHRGGHTESVGTFHYMAPEIGRGEYGREIDIYALGVLLFELLTGRVPFDGESCHEIIVKHLTALPDLTSIPQPFQGVIAAALEKDPRRRPATVTDMIQSLRWQDVSAVPTIADVPAAVQPPMPRPVGASPVFPVATDPVVYPAAIRTDEEPLARAIRSGMRDLGSWWGSLERSPKAKTALAIITIVTLVLNTHWLLPMLSLVGVFYVPYYIIRNMVLHVRQQPTYAQAHSLAQGGQHLRRPMTRMQWRSAMRHQLRAKHTIHRISELGTSSIVAILTTLFMAVVAGVIGLRRGPTGPLELAPYGWAAVTAIVGGLALLMMGKLWERGEGESLRRRIALAGLGAGVGVLSFSLAQHLMVPIDGGLSRLIDATELPQALYQADGTPRLSAFMAHFALLFAGLRWWKLVDPLRRRRLSLWSVVGVGAGEWLIQQILPIPQPGGLLICGGIAIAIQMAAPWMIRDDASIAAGLDAAGQPIVTPRLVSATHGGGLQ